MAQEPTVRPTATCIACSKVFKANKYLTPALCPRCRHQPRRACTGCGARYATHLENDTTLCPGCRMLASVPAPADPDEEVPQMYIHIEGFERQAALTKPPAGDVFLGTGPAERSPSPFAGMT